MSNSVDSDNNNNELNEHYYFDNGLLVMTEQYHLKRGYCCGNECKHCPYDHRNVKSNLRK